MTIAQKRLRELTEMRSKSRQRMAELGLMPELSNEHREELDNIEKSTPDVERQIRAAQVAVDDEDVGQKTEHRDLTGIAPETRERLELRARASVTTFLQAAIQGRQLNGAELELAQAAEASTGSIPIEIFDIPEARADAPTPAGATVGVNLDPIRPQVFSHSIASKLGIDMPRVGSGSFASSTITTPLTAGAKAKGADTDSTAAGFTVTTISPKRISARMSIRLEDIASIGQQNFESILRENLALVLSDALDSQLINGAGANDDLIGIFHRLTDPAAAPAAVSDFDAFAAAHAGGIDGLWSNTLKDVSIVCGPSTMSLAARTFQTATSYKGEMSAAAYAMKETGGFWTNKRMPDAGTFESVTDVQQAILYRKGRSMMGATNAIRTAVCPHWNEISIDDIFSGSGKAERYFTVHVLLGDVILAQPDAYKQVAFKVA